ncbi:selenium-dependent molybdenum cofactor biosynthesis protein YqeB [Thermophilibacter provencensis]|uniref:EF2563 family selenium-dependent molybdenum hydroxylase system protein n=1 Tax=Thermophilibacter provencensis TaxID=1852386 RepID=A0A921KL36_9ACTN|nr:selenium-dependent molybdenum cofactor biosynthesis protein YqeB [Thermophilibacter provencensis]HJF45010.1 EF2563 family selenium-dependent molybdenum hydroxylase system protein [Thermophilibacter provencensis]
MLAVIRGAGDIASGIALRLFRAGMRVVMCDLARPTSIRRTVCFSEAIRLGETHVEGVRGVLCADAAGARAAAAAGDVAVLVDPEAACVRELAPDVLVDAILAKRNLGTARDMAPVVIGVGPGFTAPVDCDAAVETMRGHYLGRVYYEGSPLPDTAVPGLIGGYAGERVMRAPADGVFEPCVEIGAQVTAGDVCATVAGEPMRATIDGVVRGLLQAGVPVHKGMKCGDVDPRCHPEYIESASDKALAVGGGVLEAILALSAEKNAAAEKNVRVPDVLGPETVHTQHVNGSLSDEGFVSALVAELEAGRRVGVASLLATSGSMPRHEGARLAVLANESLVGTVGGGAIEQLAIERARAARSGGAPSLEWYHTGDAMACGGDALLAVRALTADDLPVLLAVREALLRDEPVCVTECWEDVAAPTIEVGPAVRLSAPTWDDTHATYREPVTAPSRLHVFGAGHVGAALVGLAAAAAGFEVHVYDDRPELAMRERLPQAATVNCGAFDDLAASAAIGPRDSVVVLTHGHAHDETVLLAVLARDVQPAYVGCIGSARKAALAREHLVASGVPQERVDAVAMPIGLAIGAVTPAEIALAIVAQLVRRRAERRGEGPGKGERA